MKNLKKDGESKVDDPREKKIEEVIKEISECSIDELSRDGFVKQLAKEADSTPHTIARCIKDLVVALQKNRSKINSR